jgi:hypothetical protein
LKAPPGPVLHIGVFEVLHTEQVFVIDPEADIDGARGGAVDSDEGLDRWSKELVWVLVLVAWS